MRLPVFIFLLLLVSAEGLAQGKNTIIRFCPLALIDDGSFPTLQGGIEFSLSKRVSWYNEIGVRYRKSFLEDADTSFYSGRGFKAKSEIRYYLRKKAGYYLAANLFYARDVHNTAISYYYQKDSTTESKDNFGVKKSTFGMNLLIGKQVTLRGRFMLDLYAGLGVKARHITTAYKEYDRHRDALIGPIDLTVPGVRNGADAKGGNSVVPSLTAGVRLCFLL
jgi:hypothetical protein